MIGHLGDNELAALVNEYTRLQPLRAQTIRYSDYYQLVKNCKELKICIIALPISQIEFDAIREQNPNCFIIYIAETQNRLLGNALYYQMTFPIDKGYLFDLLNNIQHFLYNQVEIIDTPKGYVKIQLARVAYVNTEGRRLAYHLYNKETIYSNSLRRGFSKEVSQKLLKDSSFIFLKPCFIINLKYINRIQNQGEIELTNGEILYLSKQHCSALIQAWRECK